MLETKFENSTAETRRHNTRFLQNFANGWKTRNLISSLTVDGLLSDDQDQFEKALINFYKSLYDKRGLEFGKGKLYQLRMPLG